MKKMVIAVDFDGVLHSFSSGWQGPRVAADPPTLGAIDWLFGLICCQEVDVAIYSARNFRWRGKKTIKKWLVKHGLPEVCLLDISFPILKPVCNVFLDDRAMCFKGTFPSVADILEFEPWHGQSIWGDDDK